MPNRALLKKIWLKNEEEPIIIVRRSLLNWFWPFLISITLLMLAFFLMYYLWQNGWFGILIFSIMVILSIYLFFRSYYEHYFTCWVLTNLRLIDIYQHGFLRSEISEVIYSKFKDVFSKKSGFINSMFNLGDIHVSLVGSRVIMMLSGVRGYDRAISEIILQQENYQKNSANRKERLAQYMLIKIKRKIGVEAFNRLLGD